MVFRAYFEGSSAQVMHCARRNCESVAVWGSFEQVWHEALERNQLDGWHSSDLMTCSKLDLVKPASRSRWKSAHSAAAFRELGDLAIRYAAQEPEWNFQISCCAVHRADYERAKTRNQWLRPAEAICVNTCVGSMPLRSDFLVHLVFDRGEKFKKEIEQIWTHDKKHVTHELAWSKRIADISSFNSNAAHSYAIAAADLVAWDTSHGGRLFGPGLPGVICERYDFAKLVDRYPPAKEKARTKQKEQRRPRPKRQR